VACFLCAAACPSNCIYIEAAEKHETQRISSAERYARVYNIDYNRCIFSATASRPVPPTPSLTSRLRASQSQRTTLVMRKEDLLVPTQVLPAPHTPIRKRPKYWHNESVQVS